MPQRLPLWDDVIADPEWGKLSTGDKNAVFHQYMRELGDDDEWKGLSGDDKFKVTRYIMDTGGLMPLADSEVMAVQTGQGSDLYGAAKHSMAEAGKAISGDIAGGLSRWGRRLKGYSEGLDEQVPQAAPTQPEGFPASAPPPLTGYESPVIPKMERRDDLWDAMASFSETNKAYYEKLKKEDPDISRYMDRVNSGAAGFIEKVFGNIGPTVAGIATNMAIPVVGPALTMSMFLNLNEDETFDEVKNALIQSGLKEQDAVPRAQQIARNVAIPKSMLDFIGIERISGAITKPIKEKLFSTLVGIGLTSLTEGSTEWAQGLTDELAKEWVLKPVGETRDEFAIRMVDKLPEMAAKRAEDFYIGAATGGGLHAGATVVKNIFSNQAPTSDTAVNDALQRGADAALNDKIYQTYSQVLDSPELTVDRLRQFRQMIPDNHPVARDIDENVLPQMFRDEGGTLLPGEYGPPQLPEEDVTHVTPMDEATRLAALPREQVPNWVPGTGVDASRPYPGRQALPEAQRQLPAPEPGQLPAPPADTGPEGPGQFGPPDRSQWLNYLLTHYPTSHAAAQRQADLLMKIQEMTTLPEYPVVIDGVQVDPEEAKLIKQGEIPKNFLERATERLGGWVGPPRDLGQPKEAAPMGRRTEEDQQRLQALARGEEVTNDRQAAGRIPRPEREGQEPGGTVQEPGAGQEAAGAGGILQAPETQDRGTPVGPRSGAEYLESVEGTPPVGPRRSQTVEPARTPNMGPTPLQRVRGALYGKDVRYVEGEVDGKGAEVPTDTGKESEEYKIYTTDVRGPDGITNTMYAVPTRERKTGEGFGDTLHKTLEDAEKQVDINRRLDKQDIEYADRERKYAESEAIKKAERENLDGFDSGMSMMERGRALKVLGVRVNYKGRPISRRDLIRKLVLEGRNVDEYGLSSEDGTFMGPDSLTKTGIRYAEHLIGLRDKKTTQPDTGKESAPSPDVGKAKEPWEMTEEGAFLSNEYKRVAKEYSEAKEAFEDEDLSPEALLAEWDRQAAELEGQSEPKRVEKEPLKAKDLKANHEAKQKAAEAKDHIANVMDAFKQINDILGEEGAIGSGAQIDETKWQKIKPLLQYAWNETVAAGKRAAEFVKLSMQGLSPKGRPYFEKFVREEIGSPNKAITPSQAIASWVKDRFSKVGIPVRDLQNLALDVAKDWANPPEIVVVKSQSQLPQSVRAKEGRVISGAYLGDTAYLVAENTPSMAFALQTLAHEAWGHKGFDLIRDDPKLKPEFDRFLDRLYASKKDELNQVAERYGLDTTTPEGRYRAADEWLARQAEKKPNDPWIIRAVALVKRWLAKVFPGLKVSHAEVASWVAQMRRAVVEGEHGAGDATSPDIRLSVESVKPWPQDFPKAFAHTTVGKVTSHPEFKAAKAGDMDAAMRLVTDLVKPDRLKAMARKYPNAIVVPVHEIEEGGVNMIPLAMSHLLEKEGLKTTDDIYQLSTAKRKGLDAVSRLLTRKVFNGDIQKGALYILVDDILTQGGTIHELRHHIANNGGEAAAVFSLAFSAGSNIIAIKNQTVTDIEKRFGRDKIESILQEHNISGTIEALTESEGKAILRFKTLDALRRRLSEEVDQISQKSSPREILNSLTPSPSVGEQTRYSLREPGQTPEEWAKEFLKGYADVEAWWQDEAGHSEQEIQAEMHDDQSIFNQFQNETLLRQETSEGQPSLDDLMSKLAGMINQEATGTKNTPPVPPVNTRTPEQLQAQVTNTQVPLPETSNEILQATLSRYQSEVLYWVADKNHPIAEVQKHLANVRDDIDVFLKESMRGKRAAARIRKAWDELVSPLLEKMAEYKVEIGDLEHYKHALHAPEANETLRRANAKMNVEDIIDALAANKKTRQEAAKVREAAKDALTPDEWYALLNDLIDQYRGTEAVQGVINRWEQFAEKPSGMTDQEAAEVLREYAGDEKIAELGRMLDAINDEKLQLLYDAGLLSEKEYEAIKNKYQHYVPLYREEHDSPLYGITRGIKPTGRPIKVRGGSTKQVVNILAHSIANYERAINAAEKAWSQQALYGMIKANPNNGIIRMSEVKQSPRYDESGNLRMYPNMFDVEKNEMRLMINGHQYLVSVDPHNRDAMLMMRTLKAEDANSGWALNALASVNRFLARVSTSWSPEFLLTNLPRDLQTALVNLQDTGVKGTGLLRGAKKAWGAIWRVERGKPQGDEWEAYYERYKAAGGKMGWADAHGSVEGLAKKLQHEYNMAAGKAPTRKAITSMIGVIEDTNTAIENGVRLSVFKLAVEQGFTDERAARIASDLTVDFTRKGAAGPVVNALWLFSNANIQGSYRIMRAVAKSKKVRYGILPGIMAAGFAMGMLGSFMGGEDDDGEDYFNKLLETNGSIGERNMIFMIPRTKGKYLKMPLPWGYNVPYYLGVELSRIFTQERYSPMAGAGRMLSTMLNAFNPIQSGTLMQTLAPTILDPFAQVAENKNWFGGPLMPEDNKFAKVTKPDSEKYWKSTGVVSKWVAAQLNSLTGGDKVTPSPLGMDFSPETLDMIASTIGGSAAKFVMDTLGLPIKVLSGEDVAVHKVPGVRRFFGEKNEWGDSKLYYQNIEEVYRALERLKAYHGTPEFLKIMSSTKFERSMLPIAEQAEKDLKTYRKEAREARTEEKKQEANEKIQKTYLLFNKAFNTKHRKFSQGNTAP